MTELMEQQPFVTADQLKPTITFLSLPREIRDQIYQLHLKSLDYETSRPKDPRFQAKTEEDNFLSVRENWRKKRNTVQYPGYFNPIYHERSNWYNAGEYVHANRSSLVPWRAREHSLPALLRLDCPAQIVREVRDLFIGEKLVVGEDSLNWFQSWCLDLPAEDRAGIRKLTIASRVGYDLSAGPAWATSGLKSIRTFYYMDRKIDGDEVPAFEIRISDDRSEISVSALFMLDPDELYILRRNLGTLLRPFLQNAQRKFDGNDILEAMFAFHNHTVHTKRSLLVIGTIQKKVHRWKFELQESDLQPLSKWEGRPISFLMGVHDHGRPDKHELFRASAGEGVPEMCWLGW